MARKGEGFPMLVVCAFAFGPYVNEETRQWPNLTILITRMNPDLAMDTVDQKLLKSTGAGNLFMVFGEPDLELRTLLDGKLQVELRGLDVYDPTSGEIRSSSTDDIACWFEGSDYNEESFFVRQLQRRRRALQEAAACPQGRDRRGRLGEPVFHRQSSVRPAIHRQDRREGHQPLRGRGAEGVQDGGMKTTSYCSYTRTRPDRAIIEDECIEHVVQHPLREERRIDGHIRRWARIREMDNRALRVILLEDGETVHNAFFDRDIEE